MTTWDKICRVCASPANYDVFGKIPAYLHASSNEFINWQKPINQYIEETTGLKVTQEDGLPKCICALCISYLKHAVTFRDQVIKNALSLKVVKKLRDEKQINKDNVDKNSLLITEQELCMSESRRTDANILANTVQNELNQPKVSKSPFQLPTSSAPSQEYIIQQMRYLNLLFDKDINAGIANIERGQDFSRNQESNEAADFVDPMADYETESTSNEENDGDNYTADASKGIFSYSEKNFEEDDILDMDDLRDSINVNIPEDYKERKCRACFRRFMFEESYKQHMDNCIEFKFLNFIEEINLLLDIRRKKALSPHEFIRRMIFSLRKVCDFLKINCDEILLPAELAINNDNNNPRTESKEKESNEDTALYTENILRDSPVNFTSSGKNELNNYNVTELLLGSSQQQQGSSAGTTTPISIRNNILYEIERTQSRNTIIDDDVDKPKTINILDNNIKLMRPIPMHATAITQPIVDASTSIAEKNEVERSKFLQKLEQALYKIPQQSKVREPPIATPSMAKTIDMPISPFSAACNMCNIVFDTISGFELHNALNHNKPNNQISADGQHRTSDEERERIIAMFENEDDI